MKKSVSQSDPSQLKAMLGLNARFGDLAAELEAQGNADDLFLARHLLDYSQGFLRVLIERPGLAPASVATADIIHLDRVLDAGMLLDYANEGVDSKARKRSFSFEDVLTRVRDSLTAHEATHAPGRSPATP